MKIMRKSAFPPSPAMSNILLIGEVNERAVSSALNFLIKTV